MGNGEWGWGWRGGSGGTGNTKTYRLPKKTNTVFFKKVSKDLDSQPSSPNVHEAIELVT